MPGSKLSVVAEAKDLNPRKVKLFRYNSGLSIAISPEGAPAGRRLQSNGRNLADRPYAPRFGIENYGAGVVRSECSGSSSAVAEPATECRPRTAENVQILFSTNDSGVTIAMVIS
jgi:hypothetical protein